MAMCWEAQWANYGPPGNSINVRIVETDYIRRGNRWDCATPSRRPVLKPISTGMIKNFISSKIVSAASGECVILGLKLADGEAHAFRLAGLFLFLVSVSVLILEWRKKAAAETDSTVAIPDARTSKRSPRNSRSRAPRSR